MGQCSDAYGAIKVAVALAEAFNCGVNELPLSMVLSWYEQKAVCILLTLLHLGIQNIRLGPTHLGIKNILLDPTLPAFISPNVLNYLVENFGIAPITTPEQDLADLLNVIYRFIAVQTGNRISVTNFSGSLVMPSSINVIS